MATHYITLGQCHLLLTLLLCLGTHRIIAQNPSDVTNVNTTDITDNSFTVSWTAPSDGGITNYTVILNNGANIINETNTTTTIYEASGLSPGVTYTITIRAYNATGTSSGVLYNITTLPSPATGLEVSSESNDSVTLSWMFPSDSNSNSYNYTVSDGVTNQTVHGTNTATIQNLKPGTEYNFTVYAVTPNGVQSKPSNVVTATTQPNTVQGVTILTKSETTVTLQWTLSQDPNNNTYTYTVEVRGPNVSNLLNTTSNSEVVRDLLPGVNYNFTVFAVTKNGVRSQPSITVTATTVPSHVTDLKVTSISSDSVTLSWMFSSDSNSNSYNYTVSDGVTNQTVHGTNTATIQNLKPGTEYNFTVYAVTPNGVQSKPSNVVTVTTNPNIVQGVTILNVSETTVALQWNLSQDPNSNTYTYTVNVQGPNVLNISNIRSNSEVVRDLLPGVNYNFTVFAVTKNDIYSQPSKTVTATTVPSPVTDLKVSSVSSDSVTLSWMFPSDSNSNSYNYTVSDGVTNQTVHGTNTATIQNLKPGTEYNFTVYAVTPNGVQSKPSNVVTATTQPNTVQGVTVLNVSETTVTLQWTLSQDPNNNTYTYTVDVQGPNVSNLLNTTSNSEVVRDLLPGVNYNFTVFAVTKNGVRSQPSITVTATTVPSPVTGLEVSSVSNDSVTLSWMFSSDSNSNSYNYTVSDGVTNQTVHGTNTATIQNLKPGTEYNFTVYAVTPNGVQSKPSNVVTVTTKPNIIQGVTILTVSETTVTLQWTLSQDPNNKTYTYTVDVQGPMFSNISNVMGNIEVVRNLLPGMDYNFTVFAVTKNGVISQSSITVTTTTMPNAPGNLQGIAVNVSEIYINWTAPNDVNKNLYDYKVTWVDAEAIQNIASYTTKDTFFYTTSLFPGHLYNITVKSVIKNTASVNAEIYTATQPISIQRLSASEVNNTSVTLSWIIPTYPNSVKTGYRVTVYLNGKNISEVETTDEKYVVNNLEPGNVYRISVESYVRYPKPGITARTSTTDNYITSYSIPSLIESETDPDPVNDLKCSKMDAYQIKVEFMCPRGNYSTFKVLVNDLINNEVNTCIDNVVVSNLQPAASYKIRVMTIATAKNSSTVYIICSTDNTGVIVGSIFGVLLFILLIALIVFLVLRSRRLKNRSENIPTTFTGQRRFHTIPREKFKQHYENNHADSDFGFAEEYQELSSVGTTQSKRAAELPDNRAKNRFTNVLPYDHSRVKLSIVNGILSTDYINANYMPGYNSNKEFIACQGPLPNTTADFWRMVCEHHVNTIVMLTNCMENGRVKCEHYWPLDYTPCTYGDLTVTVTSETILSEWTIRDFSVKHATQPGIKYVRHFHYTAWPDHGVPDSTSSIMQFHNLVREYMDQRKSNGPTVVHCSAGVGRTGTLIALDYLIQQNEREHRIGVYGFVEKMRMNRNLMVQTEAQYIFLNKCMLDLIDQPEDEHIYENHTGNELVYENVSAIRNLHRENA